VKMKSMAALVALTTLYCAQEAMAAPVFVNGSFEADATTGFQSVDPSGWVTFRTGAPPYLINNNTYGNTPFGNQFLALGGIEDGATSYIEQTVSGFTVGQTYILSWGQSSEYTSSDQLRVSFVSGSATPSQVFTTPPYPGGSDFWFTWTNESMPFVADATSVDFHFQGTSAANYEVGVDNFQISGASPIPEPASLGLLSAALLLAFGLRRRYRSLV
jgi:PEP-CTERM motif